MSDGRGGPGYRRVLRNTTSGAEVARLYIGIDPT